jgi:hypothetical protein
MRAIFEAARRLLCEPGGGTDMSSIFQSTSGRMLVAAVGVASLGGGMAIVIGGTAALPIFAMSVLVGIAVSIVAVALGVEEWNALEGTLAVLSLPVVLFMYSQGQQVVMRDHSMGGAYALIALGLAALVRAALGSPRSSREIVEATAH